MSDIKYLKDGRKVVVIGKINSQEFIVQEIFVTKDGDEIPSGENFTTKSLHDEPVISYKEKRIAEVEKEIKTLEGIIHSERQKLNQLQDKNKEYLKVVQNARIFAELVSPDELQTFESFMTGTIEWIVVGDYGIGDLFKFDDWIVKDATNHNNSGLRLISVFGKGKSLSYQTTEYNDGSGGKTTVRPFNSREDAIELITYQAIERIEENRFTLSDYKKCQLLGIEISKKALKKAQQNILNARDKTDKKNLETRNKEAQKQKIERAEIENMI